MTKTKVLNGCYKFSDKGFALYLVHLGYNVDHGERTDSSILYCFKPEEIGDTPALRERILATAMELYLKREILANFSELVHDIRRIEEIEKAIE